MQLFETSKRVLKNMCMNRSKVTQAALTGLSAAEFAPLSQDKKLKCYISCCLDFMKIVSILKEFFRLTRPLTLLLCRGLYGISSNVSVLLAGTNKKAFLMVDRP